MRQTESRAEGLRQTPQQHSEESRRDRVIDARKGHLIPVRETLGSVFGAFTNAAGNMNVLDHMTDDDTSEDAQRVFAEGMDQLANLNQALGKLNSLLVQISDPTLLSLVSSLAASFPFQGLNPSIDAKEGLRYIRDSIGVLRERYLATNKRIEELLAGDDLR